MDGYAYICVYAVLNLLRIIVPYKYDNSEI